MGHIYYPYIIGTDNPIPNLFENIAPIISNSYRITIHSNKKNTLLQNENINEIYTPADRPRTKAAHYTINSVGHKYDIIHTGGNGIIGYGVSNLTKLRSINRYHVHTLRVDVDPSHEGRNTWIRKNTAQSADIVTAVSQHTAETAKNHFGIDSQVIYNGVDAEKFHPDKSQLEVIDQYGVSKPFLVFVGNFYNRKNPIDIIQTAKRTPDIDYLMVGDGPLYSRAKKLASDLDNVYLTGRLSKSSLPPIYANSSGLIFPTIQEGCPNVVLEAMSSGTPVIGYRATSMPELIESGENGYLCDVGDLDALAENAHAIINECESLGRNARSYILGNHTFEVIANDYLEIYNLSG